MSLAKSRNVALVSGSANNVRIALTGATTLSNNEGAAPYTLPGDAGVGNYNGMTLNQGVHTLTATPYTSGGTIAGTPMTITFAVGTANAAPAVPAEPEEEEVQPVQPAR